MFKRRNSVTSFEVYNVYVFKIKFDLIQCTCTVILFMFNLCKTIVMQSEKFVDRCFCRQTNHQCMT